MKHFHQTRPSKGSPAELSSPLDGAAPHLVTCTVEHDSIRLPLEHLVQEQAAGE